MRGKTRKRDIFSIPTYVINLKERPDRWERFTAQPLSSSFKNLHRFSGFNGKKLNYRHDKRLSIRTRLNISRNYRRSHYEIATLGAVGATMSHVGVWKKFVASGAQQAIVLEDDVILNESQLKAINEARPPNYGIWILGCYLPNLIEKVEGDWTRVYNFTAAHAYVITRAAALKLLEQPFPIETHIEYYMTGTSILYDIPIVRNKKIHLEFFRKDGPRTPESNTSQHRKNGCPTCLVPDDYKQLYRGYTRKTKRGMGVKGLVESPQSNTILNFKNIAERVDSFHP